MNDTTLIERYPAIRYLEARAQQRIPHFAWEYLASGTGNDAAAERNAARLAGVELTPRFMLGEVVPQIGMELFGQHFSAPFGVAPVGLTGLMWPRAELMLAEMAGRRGIPYGLSTVATESPESIGAVANGNGWFQLYPPRNPDIRNDLLDRAAASGFHVLLVTVDTPASSRRERQRRAGVSVPPRNTPRTYWHAMTRPAWALATLAHGVPRFRGIEKYVGSTSLLHASSFIGEELCNVDWDYIAAVRDKWRGPMLLKGILDPDDAERAVVDIGTEGVVVSNHGGRQFDGAPAAIDALPAVVERLSGRGKVLFDSGIRTGVDVMRALALGADMALLGRAFMFGVAALGERGTDLVYDIIAEDIKSGMMNVGCERLDQLPGRLRPRR